jgi:hypothetical protein
MRTVLKDFVIFSATVPVQERLATCLNAVKTNELGYNDTKGTEYFVSLLMGVVLHEECNTSDGKLSESKIQPCRCIT